MSDNGSKKWFPGEGHMVRGAVEMAKIKTVRKSAASAAESSGYASRALALTPASGNSAGSVITLSDLSENLGNSINNIDYHNVDSFGALGNKFAEDLESAAKRYRNFTIGSGGQEITAAPWAFSSYAVMHTAALCSQAVYKKSPDLQSPGLKFAELGHIKPSADGNLKAALFISVQQDPPVDAEASGGIEETLLSAYYPMMVIAICGTRRETLADWPMNLNMDSRNASDFINMAALRRDNSGIQAHSGFLNGAEAMSKKVEEQIRKNIKNFKTILFTGHSAGGAVASLLYAHVFTNGVDPLGLESRTFDPTNLSCITFGTPPVIYPNITADIQSKILSYNPSSPAPIFLSIINDRDIVPRLDRDFGPKLLNLLDEYALDQKSKDTSPPHTDAQMPSMSLWNLGDRRILQRLRAQATRCYAVSDGVFQNLLYVSVMQHKMEYYLKRCHDLLEVKQETVN